MGNYFYTLDTKNTPWEVDCTDCGAEPYERCKVIPGVDKVMNHPAIICHQVRLDNFDKKAGTIMQEYDLKDKLIGRWLTVRYQLDGQRLPRKATGQYMGQVGHHNKKVHLFNLRPLAGTTPLPAESVLGWWYSRHNEPILPAIDRQK